jgi:hypothetical protein
MNFLTKMADGVGIQKILINVAQRLKLKRMRTMLLVRSSGLQAESQ